VLSAVRNSEESENSIKAKEASSPSTSSEHGGGLILQRWSVGFRRGVRRIMGCVVNGLAALSLGVVVSGRFTRGPRH
jgi:hypothetical protein